MKKSKIILLIIIGIFVTAFTAYGLFIAFNDFLSNFYYNDSLSIESIAADAEKFTGSSHLKYADLNYKIKEKKVVLNSAMLCLRTQSGNAIEVYRSASDLKNTYKDVGEMDNSSTFDVKKLNIEKLIARIDELCGIDICNNVGGTINVRTIDKKTLEYDEDAILISISLQDGSEMLSCLLGVDSNTILARSQ